MNLRRLKTKLPDFLKSSGVPSGRIFLGWKKRGSRDRNALHGETRFRRVNSSVKPIIGGYHWSLVYTNAACNRTRSLGISEIIVSGDTRGTFAWLVRPIKFPTTPRRLLTFGWLMRNENFYDENEDEREYLGRWQTSNKLCFGVQSFVKPVSDNKPSNERRRGRETEPSFPIIH